jgi:hypothetical protein
MSFDSWCLVQACEVVDALDRWYWDLQRLRLADETLRGVWAARRIEARAAPDKWDDYDFSGAWRKL